MSLTSFQQTIESARNGSETAFKDLFEGYGDQVKRYIKRKLNTRLQAKVDESDLAQMVWTSFCCNKNRVLEFDQSQDMVRYLVGMARNKLNDEVRKFNATKRALAREKNVDVPTLEAAAEDRGTPSQYAMSHEKLDRIKEGMSERDKQIIDMRMQRNSNTDIANQLGIDESTVRNTLKKARLRGFETN